MTDDPTKMRNQPALTRSSGRIWLIVGGILTAVSLAVLIPMTRLPPPGVAFAGTLLVAALYTSMIVVRLVVRSGRGRLALLAAGMTAIAIVALVTATIVASAATLG